MIKIEKVNAHGWEAAVRGMRNPMNSWDKSDSGMTTIICEDDDIPEYPEYTFVIGPNDLDLMKRLAKAGSDHRKFLRMINVTFDITAPLYWWKEFDTYKVGTVANSCSTMHKIHEKEFTLDDFSHEHLWGEKDERDVDEPIGIMNIVIDTLNFYREEYLETKDKTYWYNMIQLLPTSYNQRRTIQLNYEVLLNMYHSRKAHKLDEWIELCKYIKTLPYMEEFIND